MLASLERRDIRALEEPETLQALLDSGDILEDPPDSSTFKDFLTLVKQLPAAAATADRAAVADVQAQGLTTLVSLLASNRQRELSARAFLEGSQERVSHSGQAAALGLAGSKEVLARYRTMALANEQSAPGSAATAHIELDDIAVFKTSLSPAEAAMVQAAADPGHTTHVLRLLREQRRRHELQSQLAAVETTLANEQVRQLMTTSISAVRFCCA